MPPQPDDRWLQRIRTQIGNHMPEDDPELQALTFDLLSQIWEHRTLSRIDLPAACLDTARRILISRRALWLDQ